MESLISIVVPVYNVENYLERCLESICNQTYSLLDIVVVDDGSTDGSGIICDAFARKDSRVRVVHQANGGLSAARNRGIELATGMYIGFVDSDDWIEPDMYECLWELLERHEADIAVCSHYRDKGQKSTARYKSGQISVFSREDAIALLAEDKYIRNYIWDKLYRRSLFEGISFPVGRYFEDIAVSYRIFNKSCRIVYQETPLYHYIIRENSIMVSRYNPLKEYHFFLGLCEQNAFLKEKGIKTQTPITVLYRGIHLLEHLFLVPSSGEVEHIRQQVLQEMHKYDHWHKKQLGVNIALKRWCIYHHGKMYAKLYRFFRKMFKSKRHRF